MPSYPAALKQMVHDRAPLSPLLFYGSGGKKRACATWFLHALISHSSDLRTLLPEGKAHIHSVAAIKELAEEVYKPPFQGTYRGFLIDEADRLTEASANMLLKALEETPSYSVVVLVAERVESLLPTIQSRLIKFAFMEEEAGEIDLEPLFHWADFSQLWACVEAVEEKIGEDYRKLEELLGQIARRLKPEALARLDIVRLGLEHNLRLSHALFYLLSSREGLDCIGASKVSREGSSY